VDLELDFEKRYRLVREVIETIVLTVLMFLVIRLAVQNFNIDGHSMEPGLHDAELILVDKWSYQFHTPVRGDVVVFVAPPNPSQDYIKRIIGLPGDVVTIRDTTVIVNGKPLREFYVKPEDQGNPYPPFTNRVIPPNSYFVLGDNRNGSSDSRDWGCVPRNNIVGRAALVYWPFGQDNNGLLPDVTSVYTNVPTSPPPVAVTDTNVCPIIKNPPQAGVGVSSNDDNLNLVMLLIMPGLVVICSRRRNIHANRT
jgi:signal peptidase I